MSESCKSKDSPVGRIPVEWEVKKYGEIVSLQYGKSPKNIKSDDGDYPIIGTGGVVGMGTDYIYDGESIVVGRKGTIDKPSFVQGRFWAIDTTYYTKSYFDVSPKWFFYQASQEGLSKYNEASGVPSLNRETLNSIKVLVPPLPEQQKIASILTSVDEVIEKTQSQISKLKNLKKAMMQELLTKGIGHTEFKDSPVGRIPVEWEVVTVGSLGLVVTGNTPRTNESDNYGGSIPFVSPADLGNSVFVHNTKSTLTCKGLNQTRQIPSETVLIVCIGSTIGKTGMASRVCATNQQINSIICEENTPSFVYYLMTLNSKKIRSMAGTQAVPIINKTEFSSILVQRPPLAEQKKIVSILISVDTNLEEKQRKLEQTQYLKKALMQDLLTGKVRVKV